MGFNLIFVKSKMKKQSNSLKQLRVLKVPFQESECFSFLVSVNKAHGYGIFRSSTHITYSCWKYVKSNNTSVPKSWKLCIYNCTEEDMRSDHPFLEKMSNTKGIHNSTLKTNHFY
jgi:hypothetical protein